MNGAPRRPARRVEWRKLQDLIIGERERGEDEAHVCRRRMAGVALELVRPRLRACKILPLIGGGGARRIPEAPVGSIVLRVTGRVDVDFARLVIGPEGHATNDGIIRGRLRTCRGEIHRSVGSDRVRHSHLAVFEDVKPAHRHRQGIVSRGGASAREARC